VLKFSETFTIGENSRILQSAIDSVTALTDQGGNATASRAMKMAVSDALRVVPAAQTGGAVRPRVISALVSAASDLSMSLDAKGVSKVAREIAKAHANSRCQVWLSHGVALELDWIIEGGAKVGEQIHYMRVLPSGVVVSDAVLQFVPSVH